MGAYSELAFAVRTPDGKRLGGSVEKTRADWLQDPMTLEGAPDRLAIFFDGLSEEPRLESFGDRFLRPERASFLMPDGYGLVLVDYPQKRIVSLQTYSGIGHFLGTALALTKALPRFWGEGLRSSDWESFKAAVARGWISGCSDESLAPWNCDLLEELERRAEKDRSLFGGFPESFGFAPAEWTIEDLEQTPEGAERLLARAAEFGWQAGRTEFEIWADFVEEHSWGRGDRLRAIGRSAEERRMIEAEIPPALRRLPDPL